MAETIQALQDLLARPEIHLPLILIGSVILGFLIQRFVISFLLKLAGKTKFAIDDELIEILRSPIGVSVVLMGATYAVSLCELPETLGLVTSAILMSIAVFIWTIALLRASTVIIEALSGQKRFTIVQSETKPLMTIVVKGLVLAFAVYVFARIWEKDVTAWLASAGIIGIAVGFAAKDTLANLFSGIFIIADGPYKIGHYIVLDNGLRGKVTNIGIRSTRILTRDDVEVIVPNALIGNSMIVNESGGPYEKYRVKIDVGVAYGTDVDTLTSLLMKIADDEDLVQDYPMPRVRFRQFGDSALEFQLLVWAERPELRGLIVHQLNTNIYNALNQEGIEIPYPKRDVYMHQTS